MRRLLSLVLLVKNEEKSIRGVLDSVKPFIDTFTVLDTGSTDRTRDIAREVLQGIPGTVFEEEFLGYAASRNRALELDARNDTVFSLTMSSDEFLRDGEGLRAFLETQRDTGGDAPEDARVDCFHVKLALDDGLSYQGRIIRTGSAWRYADFDLGIHEVPVHPEENALVRAALGGYIEHIVGDPIARMDNIWENHIPLLRAALERNPMNGRAIEFLIQSLEAFFPHMEDDERDATALECVDLYRRRFELPFIAPEQQRFFLMRMIDTARIGNVLEPIELFQMTDALCKADADRPESFFLRAVIASTCPDKRATEVYELARDAAAVAERVRLAGGLRNSSPLDMSTEWKAHRLAAIAAANLAKVDDSGLKIAREHIAAGLFVGGPWMLFKGIADDGKVNLTVKLESENQT